MEQLPPIPTLPRRRPTNDEDWELIMEGIRPVLKELQQWRKLADAMKGGILKSCRFIRLMDGSASQALVMDNTEVYAVCVFMEPDVAKRAKRGDLVLVKDMIIVELCPIPTSTGENMLLERFIGEDKLEVSSGERKQICWSSEALALDIKEGKVKPGRQLIVKSAIAFEAIPEPEGLNRFRYLVQEPAPDVSVERDIGSPPSCIDEIVRFMELEMNNPGLCRRYNRRPLLMKLLCGTPGSGKTLAKQAIHKKLYEVIEASTKMDEKTAGFRVFRLRSSEILSMWVGESEKNWDRFFDEIVHVASVPVNGRILPTMVEMEEIDALARQRGTNGHDPVERILTTALQRLDPINTELSRGIIVVIGTTNEPDLVDRAFLRRIGGTMDRFGMLTQDSFPKVLEKHINKVPVASNNGTKQSELRKEMVEDLKNAFFIAVNPPVVELSTSGGDDIPKYRRDFLTGACVDRTVQQAASFALNQEAAGNGDGISLKMMVAAFKHQTDAIVDQLTVGNAHKYVDLPEGEKVTRVKKLVRS